MNAPNASGWRPKMGSAQGSAPATASGDRALMLEEPLIFELGRPGTCGVDIDDAALEPLPALGRFLRKDAAKLGYTTSFTIYDAGDALRLVTMVMRDLDMDAKRVTPRSILNAISNAKNELVDDETYAQQASTPMERQVAEVYREYQRRLRAANAMDFDDLIMNTVSLLQVFPDVAEHYRRRFRHILVDEYQDTNHAQYI